MRALLVVGVDANDQTLLQKGALYMNHIRGRCQTARFSLANVEHITTCLVYGVIVGVRFALPHGFFTRQSETDSANDSRQVVVELRNGDYLAVPTLD